METLETKLDELEELLKASILPTLNATGQPGRPKGAGFSKLSFQVPKTTSGVAPTPKKDPVKIAAQLKDPDLKARLKEKLSFNQGGQWTLNKNDEEELGKGLKQKIAAGLVGASMLGSTMSHAAPTTPNQPDKTEYHTVHNDTSSPPTLNVRTYGPYQVTTALRPSADASRASTNLTHSIRLIGDAHSPQHAAAIAKEFNVDKTGVLGLKDKNDTWVYSHDKSAAASQPGHTPNLWNPPTSK